MKLILKFMKPYKKLFALTLILLFVDVIGALYIPTLVADMMNKGAAGTSLNALYTTGFQMAIASILSGIGAIWGGYTCASLASKVCRDIRNAIYEKSLTLSIYDFKQFGTASITTRTISDITTIQMALISFIQMVLPVPAIFVVALFLTIQLDPMMGSILLVVLAVVILIAAMIMRMASPLFRKLQKLLDRMSTILLENLTSVRVVRAFNKQSSEQERLDHAFQNYANRMSANLDGLSFFSINVFVVIVYWLSGARIFAGHYQIGDITALIEYALLALFYLMMAQMVILTLPRALECCHRVQSVLDHTPQIPDYVTNDVDLVPSDDVLTFRTERISGRCLSTS